MTKVAFPTDEHYPFQDDRAIELAQRIVSDFDPDVLIRGSDALDFYKVSRYQKSKKVYEGQLVDEIEAWKAGERAWADTVRDDCKKPFLMGNHEDRLPAYIIKNAPALEGLPALELQNLLEFNKFGIRMAYNNEVVIDGRLLITHGVRVSKFSAYTAKNNLVDEKYALTMMTGHTHRGGVHYATSRRRMVASYECFCLCDQNPSYVKNPDWQLGLSLATVHKPGIDVDMIPFFEKGGKYFAYWRDKEYSA